MTEDRNHLERQRQSLLKPEVAVTLWGDRGSQPPGQLAVVAQADEWRSPSGVTEDRNRASPAPRMATASWRSPSGVTEDRNDFKEGQVYEVPRGGRSPGDRGSQRLDAGMRQPDHHMWRSPYGATKDRNGFVEVGDEGRDRGGDRLPG